MEYFLDLEKIFSSAKSLKYFVTKVDTPFFNDQFPKQYPIGRDVDVICHPEDFSKFIQICRENFELPINYTRHIIDDSKNRKRFRAHAPAYFMRPDPCPYDKLINGLPMTKLHFQIDISTIEEEEYDVFTQNFKSSIFDDMLSFNNVNILPTEKEATLRLFFWKKSPKASHHGMYLLENGSRSIIKNYRDGEFKNSCFEALNKIFGEDNA